MRHLILTLLLALSFASVSAQTPNYTDAKYLAGAVPVENGNVVFRQSFSCPGKMKEDIYPALEAYAKSLLTSDVHLQQCRITQATPDDGVVAASLEETLTFKSTAWILDTARIFFQVVFEAHDGGFDATLRRIHFIYGPMEVPGTPSALAAEDWITDREALNKRGQLTKIGGKKFRYATINRKDVLFQNAFDAVMSAR